MTTASEAIIDRWSRFFPDQYRAQIEPGLSRGHGILLTERDAFPNSAPQTVWIATRNLKFLIKGTDQANLPYWFRQTLEDLIRLCDLPEGWDSYGASRIEPKVIRDCLQFLLMAMREDAAIPQTVPTSHGGIQLEWHSGGIDLEVEFLPEGEAILYYRKGTLEREEEGPEALQGAAELIPRRKST